MFFPYASSVDRNKDRGALTEITVDGTRAAMFVGMLISLLYVILASPGIRAWVGVGYGTSARVLVVLAIAIALCSPIRVITMVLAGSGRLPLVCGIRGVETVINLVLSITLALAIGPVGVAVGTLGGILLVRLPGLPDHRGQGHRRLARSRCVRRAVVPHLPPMVACAAVLLRPARRGRALPRLGWWWRAWRDRRLRRGVLRRGPTRRASGPCPGGGHPPRPGPLARPDLGGSPGRRRDPRRELTGRRPWRTCISSTADDRRRGTGVPGVGHGPASTVI